MRMTILTLFRLLPMTLITAALEAQNPQQLNLLAGTQLASGYNIGINSSGNLTNWLSQEPSLPTNTSGDLKMVCPGEQLWCAMFVTYGPSINPPRPGKDLSNYQTLIVEITGDPGTKISIGIKDATQPDDGSETTVSLPLNANWVAYAIPLSLFLKANLKNIYIPCEFVFAGGSQPQTVKVRTITYTSAPAPILSSVQSAASFLPAFGPNTWVSLFGTNLAASSRGWSATDFHGSTLPSSLDGVSFLINGQPMAVSYISPGQVNSLVFSSVAPGPALVSVTNPVGTSVPITINVQTLFAGLFTFAAPNAKYAAGVAVSDGAYIAPVGAFGSSAISRPAKPGETVEFYGTGFGSTNPVDTPGVLPIVPLLLVAPTQVLFGNTPSPSVSFAGLTSSGLYQFNVVIPNIPDGDQQIVIKSGNSTSQSNVFVPIKSGS